MNINCPTDSLVPGLRALWKEAFADSDAFLDLFFSTAYSPDRCRCITAQGAVQAALYWLDMTCQGQKFAYIYAVATSENSRGKGLCRALMEDTAAVLASRGYQGAILVPQDGPLGKMYGKMGYLPGTEIAEFFCAAAGCPASVQEITPEAYALARKGYLPRGSMELDETGLDFLGKLARFYEGDRFLVAVSREEDHLRVLEYLGDKRAAPALVAALGFTEATVRTPGAGVPFAMYRPLTPDCRKPDHLPFCFD